jgi:hypothetical protein
MHIIYTTFKTSYRYDVSLVYHYFATNGKLHTVAFVPEAYLLSGIVKILLQLRVQI